jgi:transcriptional regulator with XRE-family HTH domain
MPLRPTTLTRLATKGHPVGVRASSPDLNSLLHTGPFHAALRAAVTARGLSLDRLRARLVGRDIPVALSSLSDWQHGRRRPAGERSLTALRALEEILGVPPESLVRLLDEPARPRYGLVETGGPLGELLDQLPGSRARTVEVLSGHDKVSIDAGRRFAEIWSRTAVRALTGGVDRYILRYFGDPGCDVERVRVEAVENCSLGRILKHPAGVLVVELLFDEALAAGQTWVFEDRISDGTGAPSTEYAHGFRQHGEQHLMEIRFDAAALPVDCHAFAQSSLDDERHRTADLTLNHHHALHLFSSGVSAGLLGIGWSWP